MASTGRTASRGIIVCTVDLCVSNTCSLLFHFRAAQGPRVAYLPIQLSVNADDSKPCTTVSTCLLLLVKQCTSRKTTQNRLMHNKTTGRPLTGLAKFTVYVSLLYFSTTAHISSLVKLQPRCLTCFISHVFVGLPSA